MTTRDIPCDEPLTSTKADACVVANSRRTSARLSERIDLNISYSKPIPAIDLRDVSIIIPVRNNQDGINCFLEAFFTTHAPAEWPKEIIVVDNNSAIALKLDERYLRRGLPIRVFSCMKKGPAAARNFGVRASAGEWLLFCDSDCVPTASLLTGYLNSAKQAIAYAGQVKGLPTAYLSKFYDDEETLIPYCKLSSAGTLLPLYVITANALVWRKAFEDCGGFDESFAEAGGEDVDLGRRLWQIGRIEVRTKECGVSRFQRRFCGTLSAIRSLWTRESTFRRFDRHSHEPPLPRAKKAHDAKYGRDASTVHVHVARLPLC